VEVESESEDEYKEILIKTKMREFANAAKALNSGPIRYSDEIMNEAFRWRLK
jgi:hypothetical protein